MTVTGTPEDGDRWTAMTAEGPDESSGPSLVFRGMKRFLPPPHTTGSAGRTL